MARRACVEEGLALSADEPFMRWRYFTWLLVMQGRLALMDGAALDLARSTKAPKKIVRSCALRGSALLALGERDTARAAMAHALKVAVDLGSPRMTLSIHIALAELEVAVGRPDEARLQYGAAGAVVDQIAETASLTLGGREPATPVG